MSASADDEDLVRGLERALSRFLKRMMSTVETSNAPLAVLEGLVKSRDSAAAARLSVEVPGALAALG